MAFIPASQILRTTVEYLLDGQILANVFHIDANEAIDAVVTNAILDVVEAWVETQMMAVSSSDLEATGLVGRDLTTISGGLVERPFSTPVPGAIGSPSLPNNVAVCVTLFTDLAGRSYRGRSYMPGIPESYVTLSGISSMLAGDYAGVFIDLVDTLSTAGYELVVTSFQTGLAPRVAAVSTPITSVGVNTTVDSQRRRLPGRGT
jgi:hypothetical protein